MFDFGFRALLLVTVFALPINAQAALHIFLASLDASQEVQTPAVASPAVGSATLDFDDATTTFDLMLVGLGLTSPVEAAHFHLAPAGVNGGIVKGLGTPSSLAQAGGYAFTATFDDEPAGGLLLPDLVNGNIYVNVHTQQYPGGEVRGQFAQLVPIPEPGSWLLLAGGLVVLAGSALRRRLR